MSFRDVAQLLDLTDPLAHVRDQFVIGDPDQIYLDGNSLGRLPKRTIELLAAVVTEQWGNGLVRGWRGWYDLPSRLGAKVGQLIGGDLDEVLVCDSTSVNLFKLTVAALNARPGRRKILTDDANFPSDLYVSSGAAKLIGEIEIEVVQVSGEFSDIAENIIERMDGNTVLVSLSHVHFKSGYLYDLDRITKAAHDAGALSLWDLSHSVGAVPIDLRSAGADLAIGCTYKYLNGGPGAPAFLYVRKEIQEQLLSPIWGWFGQRDPFDFNLTYTPQPGIGRFLAGTPPILSLSSIEPGVDMLLSAGMDAIRTKSVAQTAFLIDMADQFLVPLGFRVTSPRTDWLRGSHVSLSHPSAWQIAQALIHEANVIPDFRAPDVLRLGITPLSTTYLELVEAVERLLRIFDSRSFLNYPEAKSAVT
jgi:kynureninase